MIIDQQLCLSPREAASEALIRQRLAQEKGLRPAEIGAIRTLKRSIDARQRHVRVNLTVRAYVGEEPPQTEYPVVRYPDVAAKPQVVVVGAGPAGLFAALRLIELGLRPVVVERGRNVRDRKRDLARISREQRVDSESNYCFGEGGAGAYSDGKLRTRSKKRGPTEKILQVFCQHGASTDILADAHPHIGTDRLPRVIENMRETILRCGGTVCFQTKMTALVVEQGRATGIIATDMATGAELALRGPVILATGHSARDTFRTLLAAGVAAEAKGIAVGVRLEHPAHLIDQIQYHSPAGRGQWLPAAEYSMVTQVEGRGAYSFCMCPGGFVIPAATAPEQIVVNGMSPSNRGTAWSNSGMVVEIRPEDLTERTGILACAGKDAFPPSQALTCAGKNACPPSQALAMMAWQEQLERTCWLAGNRQQTAPAQRMADFVAGHISASLPVSSYTPGLVSSPLHQWLPPFVGRRLQVAFQEFGRKSRGFLTNEAVMIGVETRTSSPVRLVRAADTLQSLNLPGLFPAGEGAGYAGGIVSAGVDGERCAECCAKYLLA